jgi:hypothetical protein
MKFGKRPAEKMQIWDRWSGVRIVRVAVQWKAGFGSGERTPSRESGNPDNITCEQQAFERGIS